MKRFSSKYKDMFLVIFLHDKIQLILFSEQILSCLIQNALERFEHFWERNTDIWNEWKCYATNWWKEKNYLIFPKKRVFFLGNIQNFSLIFSKARKFKFPINLWKLNSWKELGIFKILCPLNSKSFFKLEKRDYTNFCKLFMLICCNFLKVLDKIRENLDNKKYKIFLHFFGL